MIDVFDSTARTYPDQVFFTFVDDEGMESSYTYRQTRIAAAAMARRLQESGVRRGDAVVVDLPNCPEFVFLSLAAGYGAFTLVTLNQRLSEAEKCVRVLDLGRENIRVAFTVNDERLAEIIDHVKISFGSDDGIVAGVYGASRRAHSIMGASRDAVEDTVHFAEREAHLFDPAELAVIMFTSGTTGKAKAVGLTWENLVGSACAANASPAGAGCGLWQAALPFYHIGGFQVIVRSVVGRTPMRVYGRFDAERVLHDAEVRRATHVSVVDKMLQDMLAIEEERALQVRGACEGAADAPRERRPGGRRAQTRLSGYRCVLLGGAALNPRTVERALQMGVRVFASYGMTETSSQIASTLLTSRFSGGLRLLPGCFARIVDPDPEGFGRLAVRGPGVFGGYLNARAAFTVDGFFLTGDTAALHDGCIFVRERTSDMFVSGGENVYPAEIAKALRSVPGVSDAHVFGVKHATWGRRPVAVVERSLLGMRADDVRAAVEGKLSKLNMPDDILMVDELPRQGIGKIDRAAVERLYESRITVSKVAFRHVRLPFLKPFKTAKHTLETRDLIVVEVFDGQGRVGLGECVSFTTDWYLPETLGSDVHMMRRVLAPALIGGTFVHPREVADYLLGLPGAQDHPMAVAALETAFWDLLGRIEGKPVWALMQEEYDRVIGKLGLPDELRARPRTAATKGHRAMVPAGVVIGIDEEPVVLQAAAAAVRAGYRRVKMKIAPGCGLAAVRAIRGAYPDLLITLDANQSFTERDLDELLAYDELGVGWIEEPLRPRRPDAVGRRDTLARLAMLQRKMATPLCVDESFFTADEAYRVLSHRELRCIAVKFAKLGGIEPALRFIAQAQARGCEVWMSGMYDTGISRRVLASLGTLPGVVMPGDIGEPTRYFAEDVTEPPYLVACGYARLNNGDRAAGLGCTLNERVMARVGVASVVVS